jgi:O-methyltransferase
MAKDLKRFALKLFPKLIISRMFPNNTIACDKRFLNLFLNIYVEGRAITSLREMNNIYKMVEQTSKIPGDIAEVGVYKGGSAKVIAEFKGERILHLFDTFEGMPDVDAAVDLHTKNDFNDTSLEGVRRYLSHYNNIFFHKGFFPASLEGTDCPTRRYSLVNIDVDIYESTRSCLQFFYERMNRGGILISHDYRSISCPGVKNAFDEFFKNKPEPVIELWDTQCLFVKM